MRQHLRLQGLAEGEWYTAAGRPAPQPPDDACGLLDLLSGEGVERMGLAVSS